MNRLKEALRLVGVVVLLILLEFLGKGLAVFDLPLLGMLILYSMKIRIRQGNEPQTVLWYGKAS